MAARITRAKKKIATTRIPYRVPRPADLPERLRAVLAVPSTCCSPPATRRRRAPRWCAPTLVDRAMHWRRMLCDLVPSDTEARGLLALLLVTDTRGAPPR